MTQVRDPWFFQRWAFDTQVGNPVRKAVLSMLATMADTNTGRCEAKQETLAQGVEAGERAIRGHLRALEEAGVIARRPQFRRDRGRRGDEFLLLAPGVDEWPDGERVSVHPARDAAGSPGTDRQDPPAPNGTFTRHETQVQERPGTTTLNDHASQQVEEERAGAREPARETASQLPHDFPAELVEHARHVFVVLRSVAEQHQAKEVTPLALGRVMMSRPRKPLVRAAHDFASWAAAPPRPIRDVVASYRTWLDRTASLATVERLDAAGLPDDTIAGPPAGVTPLRRPMSNADRVEGQIQALRSLASASASATFGSTDEAR